MKAIIFKESDHLDMAEISIKEVRARTALCESIALEGMEIHGGREQRLREEGCARPDFDDYLSEAVEAYVEMELSPESIKSLQEKGVEYKALLAQHPGYTGYSFFDGECSWFVALVA